MRPVKEAVMQGMTRFTEQCLLLTHPVDVKWYICA